MAQPTGSLRRYDGWYTASLWWRVLRIAFLRYNTSGGYFMAAAIAFYALICLAPLGILAAAILQSVLGGGSEAYQVLEQAVREYGGEATHEIMGHINGLLANPGSYVANVVSIAAVVWASLRLFDAVQISLTFIWPGRRLRTYLSRKLVSLGMMTAAGLLLALLVLARFMLAAIKGWLLKYSHVDLTLLEPLRPLGFHGFGFLLTGLAYLALYKTMPVQKVPWKAATAGAVTAATLWQASLPAFLYLMTRSHQINPIYGGLGGVVVFGLWAFLGAQVLLFGAQIAAAYDHVFVSNRPAGEDDPLIDTTRRRVQMTRLPDLSAEAERVLGELEHRAAGREAPDQGTINALVLSGGRVLPALQERLGAEHKGLIPVAGHCSVEYVVQALRSHPRVRQIVLIGDKEAFLHSPIADKIDGIVEEGPDMAYNLLRAIRFLGEDRKVLLTAADTPLLTTAALTDFLDHCDPRAELCYPVTRHETTGRRVPRTPWAFMPLQDGWVTHTCHVLVDPRLVLLNQEFVERFVARRKEVFAAAGEIGVGFMLRFFLSWYFPALRYDLDSIGHRIEAMTGARHCQGILLDHPEMALALDRPEDVTAAEAFLQQTTVEH